MQMQMSKRWTASLQGFSLPSLKPMGTNFAYIVHAVTTGQCKDARLLLSTRCRVGLPFVDAVNLVLHAEATEQYECVCV